MKSGDRMNKCFFSSVKERMAGGLIMKLYVEDHTLVSLQANLVEVCDMFYSKLCAQPTLDVYIEDLNMELVSHVPCKFSLVAQKVLEAPQQKRDILM
jgi:hypothetical protein